MGLSVLILAFLLLSLYEDMKLVTLADDAAIPKCSTNVTAGGSTLRLDLSDLRGQVCSFSYAVLNNDSSPKLKLLNAGGKALPNKNNSKVVNQTTVWTVSLKTSLTNKVVLVRNHEAACGFTPIDCKGRTETQLCVTLPCSCPFGRKGVQCTTGTFDMKVKFIGNGKLRVEWTDMNDIKDKIYTMEISTEAAFTKYKTMHNATNTYIFTQLTADTTYYVRVARKSKGSTVRTEVRTAKVLLGIPLSPTGLTFDFRNQSVRWNIVNRTYYYSVCVGKSNCYNMTQPSYSTSELTPGTMFHITVTAVNSVGRSNASEIEIMLPQVPVSLLWVLVSVGGGIIVLLAVSSVLVLILIKRRRRKSGTVPVKQQKAAAALGTPHDDLDPDLVPDDGAYEGLIVKPDIAPAIYCGLKNDFDKPKHLDRSKDFEESEIYANSDQKPSHVKSMVNKFEPTEQDKRDPTDTRKTLSQENPPRKNSRGFGIGLQFSRRFKSKTKSRPVKLIRYNKQAKDNRRPAAEYVTADDVYENVMQGHGSSTGQGVSTGQESFTDEDSTHGERASLSKPQLSRADSEDYYCNNEMITKPEVCRTASNEVYANVDYENR